MHQQEKTLKSEIALLRSKLSILETDLLQCRNKIKKLMDEIQIEQRSHNQHHESRQQLENRLMSEVDRLQADIDYAIHTSDNTVKTADGLKKEVMMIEMSIMEKKKQLEKLVQEMKEVNLQSLTVSTDELPIGEGRFNHGFNDLFLVNQPIIILLSCRIKNGSTDNRLTSSIGKRCSDI